MHADFTLSFLNTHGPVTLLKVSGRLDAVAAQELRKHCLDVRQQGHKHLALDLSAVSFVASSGIGTLLALTEEFGKDGALYLAPISLSVRSVIQLLNLEPYLAIYGSLEEAIAVLR